MKPSKCCKKAMEVKGICENARNGCGYSGYYIIFQCKKCGKVIGEELEK